MFAALLVMCLALAGIFVFSGSRKVGGAPAVRREAEHLGVPASLYRAVGLAECAGAAGLLIGLAWAPLGVAAAAALVVLLAGAVISHLRVGDPIPRALPAGVLAVLAGSALALRLATI